MMSKFFKTLIFVTTLVVSTTAYSQKINKKIYNWNRVINAIIQTESEGNSKAINKSGNCVGILQITGICVKEANAILKSKGLSKRYTLSDRLNPEKSKEIFILIQEKYNPEKDFVKACRIWNEGPYYNKKIKTTEYVKKVSKHMR